MNIIGCDLHTRYQVVAWVDEETGEILTLRLEHANGEARAFYARLPRGAIVGIEATFPALWFERCLAECGHELWVGDAAQVRAQAVRAQKTDTRDAEHLLDLLRGKLKMQALVAVMRKLLHAIYGMFKSRQPFDGSKLYRLPEEPSLLQPTFSTTEAA